jgi:hypothetical protein
MQSIHGISYRFEVQPPQLHLVYPPWPRSLRVRTESSLAEEDENERQRQTSPILTALQALRKSRFSTAVVLTGRVIGRIFRRTWTALRERLVWLFGFGLGLRDWLRGLFARRIKESATPLEEGTVLVAPIESTAGNFPSPAPGSPGFTRRRHPPTIVHSDGHVSPRDNDPEALTREDFEQLRRLFLLSRSQAVAQARSILPSRGRPRSRFARSLSSTRSSFSSSRPRSISPWLAAIRQRIANTHRRGYRRQRSRSSIRSLALRWLYFEGCSRIWQRVSSWLCSIMTNLFH